MCLYIKLLHWDTEIKLRLSGLYQHGWVFVFENVSHCVAQVDLRLITILLSQLVECWRTMSMSYIEMINCVVEFVFLDF